VKTPYFLSRPRRFGKSLLCDTIKCLFEGKKELFEGLYIHDKWDWETKYPVISIVFGDEFVDTVEVLEQVLNNSLRENCENNGINVLELGEKLPGLRFRELIIKLYKKTGRQVVILVDEYDKPILDMIENPETSLQIRNKLKGFYSVIKGADEYLKFVLLTGVTKFSKVSLFSGLNSLEDLTLDKRYNAICGYTLPEIVENF
jgi:hypothetical protein